MTDATPPLLEVDDNDPPKGEDSPPKVNVITVPSDGAPEDRRETGAKRPPRLTKPAESIWNSKGFVALIAGMLTAVPALTVAVVTHLNNQAQIQLARERHDHRQALAEQDQRHKIRMDYFSRAIDPANDAEYRQRVLRFLVRDEGDPALNGWAEEELLAVAPQAAELAAVRDRLAATEQRMAAVESDAMAQRDALLRAQRELSGERAARSVARRDADRAAGRACYLEAETARERCVAQCPRIQIASLLQPGETAMDGIRRERETRDAHLQCTRLCSNSFTLAMVSNCPPEAFDAARDDR